LRKKSQDGKNGKKLGNSKGLKNKPRKI